MTSIFKQFRIVPRNTDFLDRSFGAIGEIAYDRETKTLRLYDSNTQGGTSLAKSDLTNVSDEDFLAKASSSGFQGGSLLDITYESNSDLAYALGEYDFGNNIIKYANAIQREEDLSLFSPSTYHGMTIHVHETGALYYAHAGAWRKLITDTSYNNVTDAGYIDPLDSIAYSGINLNEGSGITIADNGNNNFTITSSGGLSFSNFAVAGQTTISATEISDTINLIGSGLTITTDEESQSITFTTPQAVTEAFTRITVSGQGDIVADQSADSFQLVAGPNIAITTSPGGDSITISGTSGGGDASGVSTGQANRLARYASTGQVIQDSGENLTFDGTDLLLNGSPVITRATETPTEFFIAADDSTIRLVRDQESVKFIGGTGISTSSDIDGNITISSDQTAFSTITVAGQNDIVADAVSDTLTFIAGSNITITTDNTTDTITIAADGSGTTSNSFATISVTGQSNVVAESSTDTLTLTAGSGILLTTDADNDTITIAGTGSSQNLYETISGDTGSTTANSTTDTLTVAGGTGITTSVTDDTVTISLSQSANNLTDLSDFNTANLSVDKIYLQAMTRLAVDNAGASAYTFDQYSGNNPTIYAISGTTIAFDLDEISGHPFEIQDSTGTAYNTGLVHVDSAGNVSQGTDAQGAQTGTLYWKVPVGISGNYRYQCQVHSAMVGLITIKDFATL